MSTLMQDSIAEIQALLDQLLTCHYCGASLHDEGTYHCADCPESCEEAHHDPACRPLEELRREAQAALDRIRNLRDAAEVGPEMRAEDAGEEA